MIMNKSMPCDYRTVMNRQAINAIIKSGYKCYKPDVPDDMTIGNWLKRLGIPIQHSILFHQVCTCCLLTHYYTNISISRLVIYRTRTVV